MRSMISKSRALALLISAAISLLFFAGVSSSANATSGWSTNTVPVASSTNYIGITAPTVISLSDGKILTLAVSGGPNFSLNLYSSSDGGNSWSSPVAVTTGTSISQETMILLNDGRIAASWVDNTGTSGTKVIRLSYSSDKGTTWSSPVTISTAGSNHFDSNRPIETVYGPHGIAIAWGQSDGSNTLVMLKTSTDLSTWSSARTVSPAGEDTYFHSIATNSSGDIETVWVSDVSGSYVVKSAGSGNWSNLVTISTNPQSNLSYPILISLANGNFSITWIDYTSTFKIATRTTSDSGTSWSATYPISGSMTQASDLTVIKTSDDTLLAAWSSSNPGWQFIHTSKGTADNSTWSTPIDVNTPSLSTPTILPMIASNSDGSAMIVYRDCCGVQDNVMTAYSSDNGVSWGTPTVLTTYYAGYPGQTLGITALNATGYAVIRLNYASGTHQKFVSTYNWSAPASPVVPSLANTGNNPSLLWGGLLALSLVGAGAFLLKAKTRKPE